MLLTNEGDCYGRSQIHQRILTSQQVKEKEFLSRQLGCKGVGFSFGRYKPGEGATYVHRHKSREKYLLL